jgi:hypothetical protein
MNGSSIQIVDISIRKRSGIAYSGIGSTYKSQTHTSGEGLTLYLASVARPMIQGPGSSIYILASREWTAGRQIPFQPRNSTRYFIVETAIYEQRSAWSNSKK